MSSKFKEDEVYIVKCKRDWYGELTAGDYYRCMKKSATLERDGWCTDHHKNNNEFNYSWAEYHWMDTFEKPFKPLGISDVEVGDELLCIQDWVRWDGELIWAKGRGYVVDEVCEDSDISIQSELKQPTTARIEVMSYFVKPKPKALDIRNLSFVGDISITVTAGKIQDEPITQEIITDYIEYYFDDNFKIQMREEEIPTYKFKSDKINWNLLCADILEDNTPLVFVSDGDKYYIIGVFNNTFNWGNIFTEYYKDEILHDNQSHDIFEVNNPKECKKLVQEFTQKYKKWHKSLRRKTCNRAKGLKRTKEFSVYTY